MKKIIMVFLFLQPFLFFSSEKKITTLKRVHDFIGVTKWYPVDIDGNRDYGYYEYEKTFGGGGYNYVIYNYKAVDKTKPPYSGRVDPRYIIKMERYFSNFLWSIGYSSGMTGGMLFAIILGGVFMGFDDYDTGEIVMGAGGGTFSIFIVVGIVALIIYGALFAHTRNIILRKINNASSSKTKTVPIDIIAGFGYDKGLMLGLKIHI